MVLEALRLVKSGSVMASLLVVPEPVIVPSETIVVADRPRSYRVHFDIFGDKGAGRMCSELVEVVLEWHRRLSVYVLCAQRIQDVDVPERPGDDVALLRAVIHHPACERDGGLWRGVLDRGGFSVVEFEDFKAELPAVMQAVVDRDVVLARVFSPRWRLFSQDVTR